MAKIVLTAQGNWVGKELTPGSGYIAGGGEIVHRIPNDKVVPCTFEDIAEGLKKHYNLIITKETNTVIVDIVAATLYHNRIGMKYCYSRDTEYGVCKIID